MSQDGFRIDEKKSGANRGSNLDPQPPQTATENDVCGPRERGSSIIANASCIRAVAKVVWRKHKSAPRLKRFPTGIVRVLEERVMQPQFSKYVLKGDQWLFLSFDVDHKRLANMAPVVD
jgi:hypothetical protein